MSHACRVGRSAEHGTGRLAQPVPGWRRYHASQDRMMVTCPVGIDDWDVSLLRLGA